MSVSSNNLLEESAFEQFWLKSTEDGAIRDLGILSSAPYLTKELSEMIRATRLFDHGAFLALGNMWIFQNHTCSSLLSEIIGAKFDEDVDRTFLSFSESEGSRVAWVVLIAITAGWDLRLTTKDHGVSLKIDHDRTVSAGGHDEFCEYLLGFLEP